MKANMIGWFEIPVSDMKRAKSFYENVFDIKLQVEQFGDTKMGWFPFPENPDAKGAGGSLVQNKKFYKPSTTLATRSFADSSRISPIYRDISSTGTYNDNYNIAKTPDEANSDSFGNSFSSITQNAKLKFCTNCGAQIFDDKFTFCVTCGHRLW